MVGIPPIFLQACWKIEICTRPSRFNNESIIARLTSASVGINSRYCRIIKIATITSREPVEVCKARSISSGRGILARSSGFNGLMASLIAKLIGDKRNKGKGCGDSQTAVLSGTTSSSERNRLNKGWFFNFFRFSSCRS